MRNPTLLINEALAWLSSMSSASLFIYFLAYRKLKRVLKWAIILAVIGAYYFLKTAGIIGGILF